MTISGTPLGWMLIVMLAWIAAWLVNRLARTIADVVISKALTKHLQPGMKVTFGSGAKFEIEDDGR